MGSKTAMSSKSCFDRDSWPWTLSLSNTLDFILLKFNANVLNDNVKHAILYLQRFVRMEAITVLVLQQSIKK